MSTTLGSPSTATSGTTRENDTSHGTTGNTHEGCSPKEAMQNLAAAVVRKAILDAHPHSPQKELRMEAREWVEDLFSEKGTNMKWVMDLWHRPYKDAVLKVTDRHLRVRNLARMREELLKKRRTAINKAIGEDYIPTVKMAEMCGAAPNTVCGWVRRGIGPKVKKMMVKCQLKA